MAKRKITVTVDEELVQRLRSSDEAMSATVNQALKVYYEREARLAALASLLEAWEEALGPIPPDAMAKASAAFDEVDDMARSTLA